MGRFSKIAAGIITSGLPIAVLAGTVPSIQGYNITWYDDFSGPANTLPNSGSWIIDTGTNYPGGPANWGTGEVETYTNNLDNVAVNGNGSLVITAIKDGGGGWTSARIESLQDTFIAPQGQRMIISAEIKLPDVTGPAAVGYWPAFWALGSAYRSNVMGWPKVGEFDIMENVNGYNWVSGSLHCGVDPGGPCVETNGLTSRLSCPNSPCQGNFHTYSIKVDRSVSPERLTWYVDGVEYQTYSEAEVGDATVWANAVDNPKFVVFNVAIGGSYPNTVYAGTTPIAATVSGKSMEVNYVAVYNSV